MLIYKTTNLINNKIYVGQQTDLNICNYYLGSGKLLNYAIKKYGKKNFKKEVLERCETKEQLNKRERYWIIKLNSRNHNIGYNIAEGGTGGATYSKNSPNYEEIRIKKSNSMKGKNKGKLNGSTRPEVKKKIANSLKGNIPWNKGKPGYKHRAVVTDLRRKNMRNAMLGVWKKRKLSNNYDEFKSKISNSLKIRYKDPSMIEKARNSQLNIPRKKCKYCSVMAKPGMLKRWHNNNCKFK